MSEERIQKILARAGVSSRRKAEELIREGQVTINGRLAEIGDKVDPAQDSIKLNGKRIQVNEPHLYLLLNKPKGVVSTLEDPEGRPTVLEFVPPQFRKAIVPVGRLDFNTEGLLLLTDDGEFSQRVSHPRYGCWKTYEVKVKGRPTEAVLDRLRSGVVLDGRRTAPCRIEPRGGAGPAKRKKKKGSGSSVEDADNASWWNVELSEGRTRQIREMFYQAGHPVQKLRRVAIGPVRDPELPVGSLRELSEREVERLLKAARPTPKKEAAAGARKKAAAAGTRGEGAARPARPRKTAAQAAMAAGAAAKRAAVSEGPGATGFTTAVKRPAAPRFSQDSDGYGEHQPTGATRPPTRRTTAPTKATARPGAKTSAKPGAKKAASAGRKAGGARAGAPAPRKPGTRGPRPGTPRGTRGGGGGGRRTRG